MARARRRQSPLIRKVLVTAATGAGTFMLTNLSDQSASWSLLFSVLIGGIVLLVQFLADFEQRQAAVEERLAQVGRAHATVPEDVRSIISSEIAKINTATRLSRQIEQSGLSPQSLRDLIVLAADLPGDRGKLPYRVARVEADSLVGFVRQLPSGSPISYEGKDRDWLIALTRASTSYMEATSRISRHPGGAGFIDEGFWDSELSVRYLGLQREAIRRGVVARRLFVLDDDGLAKKTGFRQICRQQHDLGIDVKLLDLSTLSLDLRREIPDLVLFDREVSYELTKGGKSATDKAPFPIRTELIIKDSHVKKRVELFNTLWKNRKLSASGRHPPRLDLGRLPDSARI